MTDLTQDWKDEKLPDGWYYVKEITGDIQIDYFADFFDNFQSTIVEVLAEVPDYTTWQNMYNTADMEHKANNKLLEDVERLEKEIKELKKYRKIVKEGFIND